VERPVVTVMPQPDFPYGGNGKDLSKYGREDGCKEGLHAYSAGILFRYLFFYGQTDQLKGYWR